MGHDRFSRPGERPGRKRPPASGAVSLACVLLIPCLIQFVHGLFALIDHGPGATIAVRTHGPARIEFPVGLAIVVYLALTIGLVRLIIARSGDRRRPRSAPDERTRA